MLRAAQLLHSFRKRAMARIRGFTLLELLIVMGIISVLAMLSWAGFYGLRRAMVLHQTVQSFQQNALYAQRSSMLLDRRIGESWIRGVGVDLSELLTDEPQYTLFRWCTEQADYRDFYAWDVANKIPENEESKCTLSPLLARRIPIPGKLNIGTSGGDLEVEICGGNDIRYVVFESIRGGIHFYGEDGFEQSVPEESSVNIVFQSGSMSDTLELYGSGRIHYNRGADSCP